MEKTNKLMLIISVVALCVLGIIVYNITSSSENKKSINPTIENNTIFDDSKSGFSDGLIKPASTTNYELGEDEIGITEKSIYMVDINNDNNLDRITKTFFDNGNAHSYYEYKIELNKNGKYIDITPDNFRTVNGADCDLQQIKFVFKPQFKIIVIGREMGDTWIEPTIATKRVYSLSNEKLKVSKDTTLRAICDVKELF